MQRLAIVGSGPAGFYTAARLLGRLPERLAIDMFEKYPIPHGLVRYGVAPDHPEVKSVINRFDEVASHPNFRYFGNVSIGQDLSLTELRRLYDRVVLAYGASQDKLLGLTGEETTRGALSAREFVAWYNGHPDFQKLSVDLTGTDTAVIIGQGNVALDVARVLLSPLDKLAKTDITENALEHLCRSKIRHVRVVGRRGPAQMQFTTKELREMFRIPGLQLAVDRDLVTRELNRAKHHIVKQRPLKRMTDLLYKQIDIALPSRDAKVQGDNKTWTLDFLQSPRELIRNPLDHPLDSFTHILRGIILEHNQLVGPVDNPKAEGTGVVETVETGLMLRSIGYRSLPLDPTLPFDTCQCIIPNISGRILTPKRISSTYVVDNTTDASTDTVFPG
ncbi:NADPH-adrenodoxin reductase, partial [Dispira simplex]